VDRVARHVCYPASLTTGKKKSASKKEIGGQESRRQPEFAHPPWSAVDLD
jgi:hypothetical protein